MSKAAEADRKRREELKLKIWGAVAKRLLLREEIPYLIPEKKIEEHKGRRNKALRLSSDIVRFSHTEKTRYGSGTKYYVVDHFDQSKSLEEYPAFKKTWQEYHDEIFRAIIDDYDYLLSVGYKEVRELSYKGALYIYWHKEEFDTITPSKGSPIFFPKVLKEVRLKAILRAITENHFQEDFTRKLERYLSLPRESLKNEPHFDVSVRNFAAHARNCTSKMYEGKKGFLEEYEHYIKYFQGLTANLRNMISRIKTAGGYAHIVREMRKDSIRMLMEEAPLNINNEEEKVEHFMRIGFQSALFKKMVASFILKYGYLLDYDILYSDDESVEHISGRSIVINKNDDDYVFAPPQDELDVVSAFMSASEQEMTHA